MTTFERLFGYTHAFDDSLTIAAVISIAAVLIVSPLLTLILHRTGVIDTQLRSEILIRIRSWVVIALIVLPAILLGAFWAILLFFFISLYAYVEYARMTGLFRDRVLSFTVIVGIVLISLTVLDHWYGMFVAMAPLGIIAIAVVGVLPDRPDGFIQRVALATLGFLLFGVCLGHLAYFSNSTIYRPLLILLISTVALNDVFAFLVGKTLGKRKLCPRTSPNKTIAGAVGAVILTTLTVYIVGTSFFELPPRMHWYYLVLGGVLLSVCGQFGDLTLSSIKRDIGIKDSGTLIPGHGGLLDRIDSLLLTSPAAFHFIGYFGGIGLDQSTRIFTGS
jgi:phosphatidate cytidylyltransferase